MGVRSGAVGDAHGKARLFDGETVSDILAAVLRADPDWQELPKGAPPAVHRLLRRCLKRDPKYRLHDIADARLELEESILEPTPVSTAGVPGNSRGELISNQRCSGR